MKVLSIIMMMLIACQSEVPSETISAHSAPRKSSLNFLKQGFLNGPWGTQKVWYQPTGTGSVIVQGDMKFPEDQLSGEQKALYGYAVMKEERLWPDGMIWYQYEDGLDESIKTAFENGVKTWNEKVKFQWKQKTPDQDTYYVFVKRWYDGGGLSTVGRLPEPGKNYQELLLDIDCQTRCLKHEMGHVMGLWHEHSRPDRDQYIKVYYENILPDNRAYFITGSLQDSQQLSPFDFDSIMLYGSYYLSKANDRKSLSRLDGSLIEVTDSISDQDVLSVNKIWQQWFDLKSYKSLRSVLNQGETLNQDDYKLFIDTLNSGTSFSAFKEAYLNESPQVSELAKISRSVFDSDEAGLLELKKYLAGDGPYEPLRTVLISGEAVRSELRKIWKDLMNQELNLDGDDYAKLKSSLSEGISLKVLRKNLAVSSEVTRLISLLFMKDLKRDPDHSELELLGSWLAMGGSLAALEHQIPQTLAGALWGWFYLSDLTPETLASLVGQIESGTGLQNLRETIKDSHDFSDYIRSTVLSKLGREMTEAEFESFKSLTSQSSFSEVLSRFILEHPDLRSILTNLAENVWGLKPAEDELVAWIQRLASGDDLNQITSEILEHERGMQRSKLLMMNLLGVDDNDDRLQKWLETFSEQWKRLKYSESVESRWRSVLIESDLMEGEISGLIERFLRGNADPERLKKYRDYLSERPERSLAELAGYMMDDPALILTFNQVFNRHHRQDLDFKDIEDHKRGLLEAGSLDSYLKSSEAGK